MSNMPKPIHTKLLFTLLLGIGFFAVGIVYHFCLSLSPDRTFLYMSVFVFTAFLLKGELLYYKLKTGRYQVVEGVCIGFTNKTFSKLRSVKFMDAKGVESTVRLPKTHKFMIEHKYRLYFSKQPPAWAGSDFIDARLSTY